MDKGERRADKGVAGNSEEVEWRGELAAKMENKTGNGND